MDNVTALVRFMVHLKVVSRNGSRAEKMVWPCSVQALERELSLHMMLQAPQRQLHQRGVKPRGMGMELLLPLLSSLVAEELSTSHQLCHNLPLVSCFRRKLQLM